MVSDPFRSAIFQHYDKYYTLEELIKIDEKERNQYPIKIKDMNEHESDNVSFMERNQLRNRRPINKIYSLKLDDVTY